MTQVELAVMLMNMNQDIDKAIHNISIVLDNQFIATTKDNEQATAEANMHNYMVNYLIYSAINSKFKKLYDTSKKALDVGVEDLGTSAEGKPATVLNLHENNIFTFTKRQNKDGETTLVTDLVTALARAGVEKAVVDKAIKDATKPKKGNTYYDVKVVEE